MQLLTDCQNPEALFVDPMWAAEEKMDGDRLIITKRGNALFGESRQRTEIPIMPYGKIGPIALLSNDEWAIDGELMPGGQFIAFDILSLNGQDLRPLANSARAEILRAVSPFQCVVRVTGEEAKRALWETTKAEGGEGIVFKRVDAPYQDARVEHQCRLKHYFVDQFTVKSVDIARASFTICDSQGFSRGGVAASLKSLPSVGNVVSVRYEGITAKGCLLRGRLVK